MRPFARSGCWFAALLLADRRAGHRPIVFLAVLVVFSLLHAGCFTLAQTPAWRGVVAAFRALPLT